MSAVLRRWRVAAALAVLAAAADRAAAYETDQYSNRALPLADARAELDGMVNAALADLARGWQGPPDRARFARRVYRRLGGLHWVDRIERLAMRNPRIAKLPQTRYRSVFRGAPLYATRVNFFFGIGRTIRIDGTLLGTDKLGHFFSQGLKYFRRRQRGRSEPWLLRRGAANERWLFGQATTSVYSNADLVANFEGYRFYRSLFEDEVIAGKPAIVAFREGGAALARPFDWRDHVNDYWDEALHPSHLSPALQRYFTRVLPRYCEDFRRAPEAFTPPHSPELERRYAELGMRPAPQNRLDQVCGERVAAGR